MSNLISIRIGSEADTAGFQKTESAINKVTDSTKALGAALAAGVAIDLGGRIVQSLAAVPQILQQAIANGVRFNAELESATLGIAAIIKQFDATGNTSFDQALGKSAAVIDLLRQKAVESPATFAQLVQGFQAVTGAATGAGIQLKDQVNLIVLMSQALSGLGIRSEQIVQESRSLITGNINEDAAAARILGITKAQIEAAKEQGDLYGFLSEKLSAFAEAGTRGQGTLTTALSNMEDALTQLEAKVAEPVFEALREGVLALNAELSKPETVEALQALGFQIGEIVKGGMAMVRWAVENADTLASLAQGAAILGVALASMKIAQVTVALGAWAASLLLGKGAVDAETVALARNTTAQAANAAARGANTAVGGTSATYRMMGGVPINTATGAMPTAAPGGLRPWVNSLGTAGAANVALAGVGIGAGIYAARNAAAANETGNAKDNYAMLVTLDKQRDALVAQIRGAKDLKEEAEARLALEKHISEVREGLVQLDAEGEERARLEIRNLEHLLENFEKLAGTRRDAGAVRPSYAGSDEEKKDLAKRKADDLSLTSASEETRENLALASDSPQGRQDALTDRAKRLRGDLGRDNIVFKDTATATPEELRQQAGKAGDAKFGEAALKQIEAITDVERQITEEKEKQGKALDENMAAEGKAFLAAQTARGEMVNSVMEQITKELELGERRKEALADLESERQILSAQIAGRDEEARALERKRAMEKEILALESAGLDHAEAKAAAEEKSALRAEKESKAKRAGQAQIEADMAVDEAGTHRSKKGLREAETEALRQRKKTEFTKAGYEGTDLDRMVESAVDIHRRQTRGGRIGGPTRYAGGDRPGGGMHSGGMTGGRGLTAAQDWNKIFGGGIGPLVPDSSRGPAGATGEAGGAGAVAGNGKGGPLATAAADVKKGGDDLGAASKTLSEAGKKLSTTSTKELTEFATAMKTFSEKLTEVAREVKTLKSQAEAARTE